MVSDIALVTPEIIAQQKEGADGILEQAKAIEVGTKDDYTVADSFLKAIDRVIKDRREFFTPRKQRANAVWKDWVAAEKEAVGVFEDAKKIISDKMSRWYLEEERKRREEEERLREAARDKGLDETAVVVDAKPVTDEGTSGQREVWSIRVVDESAVPREFCIPDEKALTALAKQKKDAFKVPGVVAVKRFVRTR